MSVEINDSKEKATEFLTTHHLGVLATADKSGAPHAAAVYFVTDSDLNFFFITKKGTQKHQNISQNPQVSLAVYDGKEQITLQIEGKVNREEDPQKFMNVFTQILKISMDTSEGSTPPVSKLHDGEYRLYQLTPEKIRLAEYKKPDQGDLSDLFEIISLDD